jgi:hypothetical protein
MTAVAEPDAPSIPDIFPCETFREAAQHLRRPFTPAAVKFKPQSVLGDDGKGVLCVAYIDARLVYERLNLVMPHLWRDDYRAVGDGLMWCDLTVDGITRKDVGEGKGKALVSDALKRAAVHFGVGVSLYAIPQQRIWKDTSGSSGKLVSIWAAGTKQNGKPKFDARIEDAGQAHLRNVYEHWLEVVGIKAFGQPLDHGDVIDAQGDADAEPSVDQSTGEVTQGAPSLASVAQKRRLRSDITVNSLNAEVMDALFKGAGFAREDGEKVNDAINRLSSAQCSTLIDTIAQGAVKTGGSDVPSDASGFEHPPAPPGDDVPFATEAPS